MVLLKWCVPNRLDYLIAILALLLEILRDKVKKKKCLYSTVVFFLFSKHDLCSTLPISKC